MSKLVEDANLRYIVTLQLCPTCLQRLLHIGGESMDLETVRKVPVMNASDPEFAHELQITAQVGLWRAVEAYAVSHADDDIAPVGEADICGEVCFFRLPYPKFSVESTNISGRTTGSLGAIRTPDQ